MSEIYNSYSKEELIDLVIKLEKENSLLKHCDIDSIKHKYANTIMDSIPDMLSMLTYDGDYVELLSSETTNHTGVHSSNLIGQNILEFLDEEACNNVRANLNYVKDTKNPSTAFHNITLEGVCRNYENRVFPIDNKHVLCICRDITEPTKAKEEADALKYAINSSTEAIYACKEDGSIEFVNNRFKQWFNKTEDVIGEKIYDLFKHTTNKQDWEEFVLELQCNGDGSLFKMIQGVMDEDNESYVETISYITKNNKTQPLIWFFSRNSTQRVKQQKEIAELNVIMDAVLNNIPVYLFVKDIEDDFRYLYWNKAFEQHSQIPAEKAVGYTDMEIFPNNKDALKFRKDDTEVVRNGKRSEYIEEYQSAGGQTRIVQTLKDIVKAEGNRPLLIGVSWDITDLKNTEKKLIASRLKAEQSDNLKSAFLANMSHEIRTPLNAIVGFSKLIATTDNQEEKDQYSDIIENNSNLLVQLINDILDISKIEAGILDFTLSSFDLCELCREVYETHKSRTKNGVQLIYDNNNCHDFIINNERNRLLQVITNLITNAIKFTNKGEIRFGFNVKDGKIVFYVKDTGIGLSKEQADSVFDRFTKLNSCIQGTGLGLAISKMIISKLEGSIWVESTEGIGSTFSFAIPSSNKTYIINPDNENNEQKTMDVPKQKRVLIAEDIDSNYLLIKAILGKKMELIRANDGLQALNMFQEINPDLILMDMNMPVMDGLESTRKIREISKSIPIIAVTAFAFENDRKAALEAGCDDFVTKPVDQNTLFAVLDRYLGKD